MGKKSLDIFAYESDKMIELDLPNKQLLIRYKPGPYIPVAVYKSFVKMALAIAPDEYLPALRVASDWVLEAAHAVETIPIRPLSMFRCVVPGPKPFPGVHVFLLRRRPGVIDAPYMMLLIGFGNLAFQLNVPCPDEDAVVVGKTISVYSFPFVAYLDLKHGMPHWEQLDMTSSDVRRDGIATLAMHVDDAIEHNAEPGA
jgi:hypothetical protein